MNEPSFLLAFIIGFLSFLSPCILPVLPGYFSYLAGLSREENDYQKRLKTLVISFVFVIGFLLVLVILGATASIIGQFLLKDKLFWQKVGGVIIVVFGLQTMGFLKINFFQREKNWHLEKFTSLKNGKAFLAGTSFGFAWTPCIGPILGSILILAGQTQTLTRGIGLLTFFALGLAIPMVFSGFFLSQLKFLSKPFIPLISGGILVLLGIILFLNQYSKLAVWTAQVYRFLDIPIF